VRLAAALLLVVASGALYWITVAPQFAVDDAHVTIDGAHFTDPAAIRAAIGLPQGANPNIFRLRTQQMRLALETLPPVLSAEVSATLPDRLSILLTERSPIFAWRAGGTAWLSDVSGVLFAPSGAGASAPGAAADSPGAVADSLPAITDVRAGRPDIQAGSRLDGLDLETARLLGALTPDQLGSAAHSLAISVDDADGWVVTADTGWRAVFGHYTPVLHTTADIPAQVQCLRSLLSDREARIETVTLAVGPDRCGTFSMAP
jgi:POTRA domain, FtsQ-type